jgi:DNA-binding CsgD family transcriptional regulator
MRDTPPLIGREMDLAVALEQLKRIETGAPACVLLRGEAGIGKTRLAMEVLARAEQVGHATLVGRADEFDRGIPYAIFRDMLARLSPPEGARGAARAVEELRQGLDVDASFGGAPADAHLSLVFARAVDMFRALAAGSPTVLLAEDVHLADEDSLALLSLLARLGDLPLLTIATQRPRPGGGSRDLERLIERMAREGRGAVIDLEPLDRHEVQALVGAALGAAPDDQVVETTLASSGGNPFFAQETMRSLQDAGALVVEQGRAHLRTPAPENGQGPNAALVARLFGPGDDDAIELAKVMAAFGRFSLSQLPLAETLTGLTSEQVTAAFDRLVREQLLVRDTDGGYGFAHAIVRDTLYEEIGPAERRRIHASIAEALAKEHGSGAGLDVLELATHVAESADPGDEAAVEVLLEAGRKINPTAPLVSAEYFRRAAELLPAQSPRRASVRALQARALHIGSRPLEAATAGREALPGLPPGPIRRSTVAIVVDGLNIGAHVSEALEVVEAELEAGGGDCPLLMQRMHLLYTSGRTSEALALLPAARDALAAASGPQITATIHLLLFAFDVAEVELAEQLLERLEELAASGPPQRRLLAHEIIAFTDRRTGIVGSLEEHLEAARELRPTPAWPSIGGQYEVAVAWWHWLRGRWDEALEVCRSAGFDLGARGVVLGEQMLRSLECEILVDRGALDEAGALARTLTAPIPELGNYAVLCQARVQRALDDGASALAALERQRDRADERRMNWKRAELLAELADLLAASDRLDDARAVAEEVEAEARAQSRYDWPLAALRLRAELWEDIEAARAYSDLAEAEQIEFEEARAALVLGTLDVDRQDTLTRAYKAFDALDAGPWRRRAATELRTRGLKVPRPARRGGDGGALTDTEARLVRLVRDGLTNRQIATAMHYSPKTVEVYLSRIYAKTRCASRVELVRALESGSVSLPSS